MHTYIVLLRAINVGGNNRVPMQPLREALTSSGFTEITTYLNSGNVILQSTDTAEKVAKTVQEIVQNHFNCSIGIIVKTVDEIRAAIKNNPYLERTDIDLNRIQVMFLDRPPTNLTGLAPNYGGADEWQASGSTIYLHYPEGSARSKLINTVFERTFAVTGTMRNWNTTLTLERLAANLE